ncbi:MAG: hypothetical protein HY283_01360 [Nitrospirae bacterium]|nr:hypothetical protein [Nitrospirota bacterium]
MFRFCGVAIIVALACLTPCLVFAQGPAKCDFETELGKLYSDAQTKRENLAVQQKQVLGQIRKIIENLPENNKPIGEQLDKEGLANFEKLRERQFVLMNVSLSESKRMRDMQFFRKFAILAEKDVRFPEIPPSDHPDFIAYIMLTSARQIFQGKVEISEVKFDQCNLEAAIQTMEQDVIDRVNAKDNTALNELLGLQSMLERKYKTKDLDPQKISEADQKALKKAIENNEPMQRLINLAKDYEILKVLVKASQLIYDMDKEDILTYGADAKKIGSTLMTKANAGKYGDMVKRAHAVMLVMDKKIPSDDAKDIKKLSDEAEADRKEAK